MSIRPRETSSDQINRRNLYSMLTLARAWNTAGSEGSTSAKSNRISTVKARKRGSINATHDDRLNQSKKFEKKGSNKTITPGSFKTNNASVALLA